MLRIFEKKSFPIYLYSPRCDFLTSYGSLNSTSWVHEALLNYLDDGFPGDFKSENDDKDQFFELENLSAKVLQTFKRKISHLIT